ncbi:hypothetical protein EGR_10542 [Echinococcus granulosus]|uniref:Uncharacterized protein n=1 Tax=Echinococcus granulosus TaxID=6210 RepID=W6UM85_ECHGR|nr:hypothetical protein EGR_10542 [Echinococcus granulosus]EUB54604.1 hypothetical protein EGR_10542 [Echinococcus granulosus]
MLTYSSNCCRRHFVAPFIQLFIFSALDLGKRDFLTTSLHLNASVTLRGKSSLVSSSSRGCGYGGGIGRDEGSGLFGRAFEAPLVVGFMPDSPTRPLMLRKNSSVEIGVMTMEVRFDVAMEADVFEEVKIRLKSFFPVINCL